MFQPKWQTEENACGVGPILVVENDFSVRQGIRQMASQCGFPVLEAVDGQTAIEAFRLHHEQLAWVLLAMEASPRAWSTLFQEMRTIDGSVPIVLGCMADFPGDRLAEGLAGLLRKPYRAADFRGLLRLPLHLHANAT